MERAGALTILTDGHQYADDDEDWWLEFCQEYNVKPETFRATSANAMDQATSIFFRTPFLTYFLHLIFHGDERDGGWTDPFGNCFSLANVLRAWHFSCNSRNSNCHLVVVLDACFSGHWIKQMAKTYCIQNVSIQSSCSPEYVTEDALDSFTALWTTVNLNTEEAQASDLLTLKGYLYARQPWYTKARGTNPDHELFFLGDDKSNENKIRSRRNLCSIFILKKPENPHLFKTRECQAYYKQMQVQIWENCKSLSIEDIRVWQREQLDLLGEYRSALEHLTAMLNITDLETLMMGPEQHWLDTTMDAYKKLKEYREDELRQYSYEAGAEGFHVSLEAFCLSWMLQLRLCSLPASCRKENDLSECTDLLQEMLNLQDFNTFDSIAQHEILEAVAVYNEQLLADDELVEYVKLAGETLEQTRRRLNRELARIKAELESGIRTQQFRFKYFEYGAATLRHKAAARGAGFQGTQQKFVRMLEDVSGSKLLDPKEKLQSGIGVRVCAIQTYGELAKQARNRGNDMEAKKREEDLSQAKETLFEILRAFPSLQRKRKFDFWIEQLEEWIPKDDFKEFGSDAALFP